MKVMETTPTRLVLGGWKFGPILLGMVFLALPVVVYPGFDQQDPAAIWINLLVLIVVLGLALRMVFRERIELDAEEEECRFDQLRLIGRRPLMVYDGPLEETLDGMLNGPRTRNWGIEVLKTTPEVDMGGMTGFSIARRIPEGGSTPLFGEVGADVATRQVWLGADDLHVEMVGMARPGHADIQSALDAMFQSIRRPPDKADTSQE